MNTRKLLMKISYGFIGVLVIVLVGLLVYQQRQIRQMSQNEEPAVSAVVARSPDIAPTAPAAGGGMEHLAAEVDTLRNQLEASEEELAMAREDLANEEGQGPDIKEAIAMNKKMQENPTLRAMMQRERGQMVDRRYGAFFEKLGLPDEKLQEFKTFMVDYMTQMDGTGLVIMDPSLSEEERDEQLQQIEDREDEFEEQAREILGDENYEKYDAYDERLMEWDLVHGAISPLSEDLGLSDEKEQELIDAMYVARKEVEAEYGIDSTDLALTLSIATQNPEEGIARQIKKIDCYIEVARGILSESQADEFETRMNEQKEMMKMSSMLMGGGSDDS